MSWRARQAAHADLAARHDAMATAAREADYLRHVVDELSQLDPSAGEEASLAERRAELVAAEKITGDLAAAASQLSDDGVDGALSATAHRLTKAASAFEDGDNALTRALDKIDSALSEIMEARAAVDAAAAAFEFDAEELERTEERLFSLRAAARKHGVAADRLPEVLAKASETLETLDAGAAGMAALEKKAAALDADYAAAAKAVSAARRKAGGALEKAVARELAPLKLDKAAFAVDIDTDADNPGPDGIDAVEFLVATNPGAPAGPLKTIASGGELSRFILAMKAALAAKENRTVIIFDEVDAGVGGAVADAVGERLLRLGADAQVLVVTHSPQVAARATRHWLVEKDQGGDATTTHVRALDDEARVDELARMLSGAEVTDEARAAAASLLGKKPAKPRRRKKSA